MNKFPLLHKLLAVVVFVVVAYAASFIDTATRAPDSSSTEYTAGHDQASSDQVLADAFKHHKNGFSVQGNGEVIHVLPDDTKGSRHQRFLVRLASGQTLLIAHNIDLAPRVSGLSTGSAIEFLGDYEWSDRGGVVHWTHKDPRGHHRDGWLKHQGRLYQ